MTPQTMTHAIPAQTDPNRRQSAAPVRSLLLLPDGAINPKTGGGQRSLIFFNALKQLGPVDVAIAGEGQKMGVAAFFDGAASVHLVPSARFPTTPKTGLDWLRYNLKRFLFVERLYAPEAQTSAALEQLITPDHQVVLTRYALPFCISGLVKAPDRAVFVDIDDRDDQKFLTAAQAVLGQGALGRLFSRRVIPAVRRQLERRLQGASLLWYATPEDDLGIDGPATAILRNVPFNVAVPDPIPPASGCKDVLFVGSFAHRPNQDGMRWFLREVWPDLSARHPEARLRVVGIGPWQNLETEFPGLDRVEYVGTVDDIAAEYLKARLVVSPIFDGGGSKIKVIEACAYARPVVASTHSIRGFGQEIEAKLLHADRPDAYMDLCSTVLTDGAAADTLGTDLRALQQAQFSQEAVERQIAQDVWAQIAPGVSAGSDV